MDRYSKFLAIAAAFRNAQADLELVAPLVLPDGTISEVTHARRAVCTKVSRKANSTVLTFKDVDLAALDQIFPFETFTVADWPNLFADDVGKRVCQGVGTARKVPLALIDTDGATFWTYAGPKVLGAAGNALTVYRGSQAGEGAIVDASEYTQATRTAPSGYSVATVTFSKEQVDFSGKPYILEADYSLPGSRTPADELARILAAYGIATDAATFAAAAAADAGIFAVDTLYGGQGRSGSSIVADLCAVARAWLVQTSTGAWALAQDVAKASSLQVDTSADQVELLEYGDGDIPKTVTLAYRPKAGLAEDWTATLQRTTTGASGDRQMRNPYVSDHTVADRLICYWQKRLNTLRVAKASIHAAQLANGAVLTITDGVFWKGAKDFIATGITRGADANDLTLREYDAAVYVYTAGTLPADATNGYSPDYSFTPPAAPTGLAVASQGTTTDVDGKISSWAVIRATPPAANWSRLMVQVTNATTGEEYQAQLLLVGGIYQATIAGLRPNANHSVIAWAVNANNVDGLASAIVNFTSSTSSVLPAAPASLTIAQTHSFQVDYSWPAVTPAAGDPPIDAYILEQQAGGGGSWIEIYRGKATSFSYVGATTGQQYTGRVRAINRATNQSATSTTSSPLVAQKMINDNHIVSAGVSGTSIASSSINQGRTKTTTVTLTGTTPARIALDEFSFFPNIVTSGAGLTLTSVSVAASGAVGCFAISGGPVSYSVTYRNFIT